jgi:hypothetical protein
MPEPRLPMLGGNGMSQRVVSPETPDVIESKQQFRQLLNEALNLADALSLPAEIGARLQEVIDLTDNGSENLGGR